MKKTLLIPILLTSTSLPLVSITGCGNGNSEPTTNIIPISFLKIEEKHLKGLDEKHQKAEQLEGYDTLIIPADIEYIDSNSFIAQEGSYDAPTVIKEINYEPNCVTTQFAYTGTYVSGNNFQNLPNLEKVYFPPYYKAFGDAYLFDNCPKLSYIDLSQSNGDISFTYGWINWSGVAQEGKIIFSSKISDDKIKDVSDQIASAGINWQIIKLQESVEHK